MLGGPPKWGCSMGSLRSNRAPGGPGWGGRGATGAALHVERPRASHWAMEVAASSLELLLHPHTSRPGWSSGTMMLPLQTALSSIWGIGQSSSKLSMPRPLTA